MESKTRTLNQNNAIHLYLTNLSQSLNDAGYDIRKTLKEDAEIPWTMQNAKDLIWRKIQIAMYGKESTTELTTDQVGKIYEVINRHISEKFGITVEFPSDESLMNNQLGEKL